MILHFQKFQTEAYWHLPETQIAFLLPEKRYCKLTTSLQRSTLCKTQINTAKLITNYELNTTEKIKDTGNYKKREVIYAAQCSFSSSW